MSFYLLNKPIGPSSAQFVNQFKKQLTIKSAGFSGTLDPFASGLLIVATGKDTKLLTLFLLMPKTYIGEFEFGYETTTLDITGDQVKKSLTTIELDRLKTVINDYFIGQISQIPPKFSAVKVNGRRAYELARKHQDFTLKPVNRTIYSFDVEKLAINKFSFTVTVSSGTYIRALIRDLAIKLNSVATLTKLTRTAIGDISLDQSQSLDGELIEISNYSNLFDYPILPIENQKFIDLLNGKKLLLAATSELLFVVNENRYLFVERLDYGKYKIKFNLIRN